VDPTPTRPSTRATHGRLALVLGVASAVVITDLVSKLVVVKRLEGHPPLRLLDGLLVLDVTRNSGAAFSIGTGVTVVFTIIAVAVAVFVVRQARRLRSTAWALTLGALLGGAVGNLICRIFRSPGPFRGHVVDWIELPHWPVFNVADAAITVAGVSVVALTLLGVPLEGRSGPDRG